jgi:hypothetical protein
MFAGGAVGTCEKAAVPGNISQILGGFFLPAAILFNGNRSMNDELQQQLRRYAESGS